MNRNADQACLTDEDLIRMHSGDLSDENLEHARSHLKCCATCSQRNQRLLDDHDRLHKMMRDLVQEHIPPAEFANKSTIGSSTPPGDHSLPKIEGYRIIRIIGRGGMGIVYEAVQEKLGRHVALKLLPSVVSSAHQDLVKRFRREAAAAAKLHHTNIIPIYDFGESRDGYFYAMELLDGVPLSTVIKRIIAATQPISTPTQIAELIHRDPTHQDHGAMDSPSAEPHGTGTGSSTDRGRVYYRQIASWVADTADALAYAHLQGLIHRDIKPSNLMLCRDGRVVVVDFGLVKQTGDESVTLTGSLLGTYRYMSPEQIGAKRITVDSRTDVYSLGATLYELLTFQPPFTAVEQSELLGHILWNEPAPPRKIIPSVPIDLQTICLKSMEKSPSHRYASAKDMADDLRQFISNLPIKARPIGSVGRAVKLIRRRPIRSALVVAVGLLSLALGLMYAIYLEVTEKRVADLIKQGYSHAGDKRWSISENAFREALSLDPDNAAAIINYAYMKKDQYYATKDSNLLNEAIVLADRAIAIDPTRSGSWNAKIIPLRELGRFDEALGAFIAACDSVDRNESNYYALWVNRASIHALLGDLDAARNALDKGIEISGGNCGFLPYRNLAAVQFQQGDDRAWETLRLAFTKESRLTHRVSGNLILRAWMRLTDPRHLDKRAALEDAIKARGIEGDGTASNTVAFVLACARIRNGQPREAARELSTIDTGATARRLPVELLLGIAEADLGSTAAASEHLEAAESLVGKLEDRAFVCWLEQRLLFFVSRVQIDKFHSTLEQRIGR